MFKKSALALILFASSSAFAGNINLDFRFDNSSVNYNDTFNGAGYLKPDYSKNYLQTAKIDYQGKFSDSLPFRVRMNFTKSSSATQKRDSVSEFFELGYITHNLNPELSVTAGKFASDMGGWEGTTTTADQYGYSEVFEDNYKNLLGVAASKDLSIKNQRYYTGAKISYKVADQDVALHFANNKEEIVDASGDLEQTSGYQGLVYKGSFLDKMLQPIVSFHTVKTGADDKYENLAIGLRTNVSDFVLDLDFLKNDFTGAANDEESVESTALAAAYKTGAWTPKVKYTMSTRKDKSATDEKVDGLSWAAAIEYKPNVEDPLRYHLAYVKNEWKKVGAGDDKLDRTEIVLGVRLLADFLK